jgi:uridine kinase
MSQIRNEIEYINATAREDPAGFIAQNIARYQNIITAVAQRELRQGGHKLVLLAGPSASGKTTTAGKLAAEMKHAGVQTHSISLDDFYYESDHMPLLPDGMPDIESVYALDLPLLRQTLQSLMEDGQAELPHFKFSEGRRSRWELLTLARDDMIVLEGLHALNPEITGIVPEALKIYINVSSHIYDEKRNIVLTKRNLRLVRRILRDSQFRGSGAEETIAMWPAVTLGENLFLSPCKEFADVRVNTIHLFEPCVFAPRVLPLLNAIPGDSPVVKEGRRLARTLRQFEPLDGTLVPEDCLLREFLGNG